MKWKNKNQTNIYLKAILKQLLGHQYINKA